MIFFSIIMINEYVTVLQDVDFFLFCFLVVFFF